MWKSYANVVSDILPRWRRALIVAGTSRDTTPAARWPRIQPSMSLGFLADGRCRGIIFCKPELADDFFSIPLRCHMINDDGEYYCVLARPVRDNFGALTRAEKSINAFIVDIEFTCDCGRRGKADSNVPKLGRSSIAVGENVLALGSTLGVGSISIGTIVSFSTEDRIITTTCECVHGYCGAPLFTMSGEIIGMGASIPFDNYDDRGLPSKRYGQSYFDWITNVDTK